MIIILNFGDVRLLLGFIYDIRFTSKDILRRYVTLLQLCALDTNHIRKL